MYRPIFFLMLSNLLRMRINCFTTGIINGWSLSISVCCTLLGNRDQWPHLCIHRKPRRLLPEWGSLWWMTSSAHTDGVQTKHTGSEFEDRIEHFSSYMYFRPRSGTWNFRRCQDRQVFCLYRWFNADTWVQQILDRDVNPVEGVNAPAQDLLYIYRA